LFKQTSSYLYLSSIKYGWGAGNDDASAGDSDGGGANDDLGAGSLVLTVPFSFTGIFRRGFTILLRETM
jgi:hypothetical protein